MKRPAHSVIASSLAALLVAACATAPAGGNPSATGNRDGDQLLLAGDFDGAAAAFQRDIDAGTDSPVVREKLANARHRAALAHASAALRAADAGDTAGAEAEIDRADAYGADAPAVRDAHRALDARMGAARKAAELRSGARAIVAADPTAAERMLAEAQGLTPDGSTATAELANLRREATLRAEADRSAERAEAAWAAGDRERTVRELEGAVFANETVPRAAAVRRRIEQDLLAGAAKADEASLRASADFAADARLQPAVARVLKDRLVDKLVAAARNLADTHRPAVAALLELEAKRLRGDVQTPSLDLVHERATVTVLVAPFEDATGGSVDGMRLARALRERLALDALGGGLPLRALDDGEAARAAHPGALRLTGRVLSARTSDGRLGRETRNVTYQTGTARRENAAFASLMAKIGDAAAAVRTAEDAQKDALTWLNSVRALPFIRGSGTPRQADVEYQTRLAAAQARMDKADRELTRARDAEFALRQQAQVTPREVDEAVYAEHAVTVTTTQKTSQLTARVDLAAGTESLLAQEVTAAAQHKETIADGFAPAGLAPDPDDTPDDASLAAQAADRFAAVAAGRVRAAAESAARHFLAEARAAEGSGRTDDAAEGYAMYLLATPDVLSPERAAAARALGELLGIHVALRTTPRKEEP